MRELKKRILKSGKGGFTLIETLVAISILALAIVAPMTLTTQSLSSAYYARDQMTAFHLAQEAIESVRAARDENILRAEADLLAGIPAGGVPFVIDTRDNRMVACDQGTPAQCPFLRTPESADADPFYAYGPVGTTDIYSSQPGWASTRFRRTITAQMVEGSNNDEMKITVTVSWQTGAYQSRTVTMRENLYRWISDASFNPGGAQGSETFTVSGTFTVPNFNSLTVQCWGGGGGGGGDGSGAGNGGDGGASVFAGLTAGGGLGGPATTPGGSGGSASGGDTNTSGDAGGTRTANASGDGGNAPLGGSGGASVTTNQTAGKVGQTPGGGGSGGKETNSPGSGGGSGAYVEKVYGPSQLPIEGQVAVTIGAGGAGGSSGTYSGGTGARGECRMTWE